MIHLKELQLRNFRCFDECKVGFHSDITVLVARNGQGKTALLDAIAISLGLFVDTLSAVSQWRRFEWRDVRRVRRDNATMSPAGDVEFIARGEIYGEEVSWSRKRRGDTNRARTSRNGAKRLTSIAEELRKQVTLDADKGQAHFELPLFSYHGTDRRWDEHHTTTWRASSTSGSDRFMGYVGCLNSSATYGLFAKWYEATSRSAGEDPVTGVQKANRPELLVAAVNRAVDRVLEPETGWSGLHWDQAEQQIRLKHPVHGHLPLSFLSDGIRNTVALVADVAHRCARLNPHLGVKAAEGTPGILLIDEVDLHLHPEWQQLILEMLRSAFPRLQLIVSTHSPQILSTVDVSAIRVMRLLNGGVQINTPAFQTKGVESADVLAAIMGVDPVPKVPEARWLSDYRVLIEEGQQDNEAAMSLKQELLAHFGQEHPLMLECDRLIRFTQFKRRRSAEGGTNAPP